MSQFEASSSGGEAAFFLHRRPVVSLPSDLNREGRREAAATEDANTSAVGTIMPPPSSSTPLTAAFLPAAASQRQASAAAARSRWYGRRGFVVPIFPHSPPPPSPPPPRQPSSPPSNRAVDPPPGETRRPSSSSTTTTTARAALLLASPVLLLATFLFLYDPPPASHSHDSDEWTLQHLHLQNDGGSLLISPSDPYDFSTVRGGASSLWSRRSGGRWGGDGDGEDDGIAAAAASSVAGLGEVSPISLASILTDTDAFLADDDNSVVLGPSYLLAGPRSKPSPRGASSAKRSDAVPSGGQDILAPSMPSPRLPSSVARKRRHRGGRSSSEYDRREREDGGVRDRPADDERGASSALGDLADNGTDLVGKIKLTPSSSAADESASSERVAAADERRRRGGGSPPPPGTFAGYTPSTYPDPRRDPVRCNLLGVLETLADEDGDADAGEVLARTIARYNGGERVTADADVTKWGVPRLCDPDNVLNEVERGKVGKALRRFSMRFGVLREKRRDSYYGGGGDDDDYYADDGDGCAGGGKKLSHRRDGRNDDKDDDDDDDEILLEHAEHPLFHTSARGAELDWDYHKDKKALDKQMAEERQKNRNNDHRHPPVTIGTESSLLQGRQMDDATRADDGRGGPPLSSRRFLRTSDSSPASELEGAALENIPRPPAVVAKREKGGGADVGISSGNGGGEGRGGGAGGGAGGLFVPRSIRRIPRLRDYDSPLLWSPPPIEIAVAIARKMDLPSVLRTDDGYYAYEDEDDLVNEAAQYFARTLRDMWWNDGDDDENNGDDVAKKDKDGGCEDESRHPQQQQQQQRRSDGVLIFLSVRDRVCFISTGGGSSSGGGTSSSSSAVASVLPWWRLERVVSSMRPSLRRADYASALLTAVTSIGHMVESGPPTASERLGDFVRRFGVVVAFAAFTFLFAAWGEYRDRRRRWRYADARSKLDEKGREEARKLQRQYRTGSCPICLEAFDADDDSTKTEPIKSIDSGKSLADDDDDDRAKEDGDGGSVEKKKDAADASSASMRRVDSYGIPLRGSDGLPLKMLRCGHVFDQTCWRCWIDSGQGDPFRCPICRRDVTGKEEEDDEEDSERRRRREQASSSTPRTRRARAGAGVGGGGRHRRRRVRRARTAETAEETPDSAAPAEAIEVDVEGVAAVDRAQRNATTPPGTPPSGGGRSRLYQRYGSISPTRGGGGGDGTGDWRRRALEAAVARTTNAGAGGGVGAMGMGGLALWPLSAPLSHPGHLLLPSMSGATDEETEIIDFDDDMAVAAAIGDYNGVVVDGERRPLLSPRTDAGDEAEAALLEEEEDEDEDDNERMYSWDTLAGEEFVEEETEEEEEEDVIVSSRRRSGERAAAAAGATASSSVAGDDDDIGLPIEEQRHRFRGADFDAAFGFWEERLV